jgi:hypothetical protein
MILQSQKERRWNFLDLRSSMNAGTNITAVVTSPALWGIVGLQTQGVANPINVLSGSIGFNSLGTGVVRITVHRGPLFTDPVFYTNTVTVEPDGSSQVVPVDAQDLNAPAGLQTTYSAFVSAILGTVTRVGPETFWGISSQG